MTSQPTPMPDGVIRNSADKIRRYYIRDVRQQSAINGKPDGGWLHTPPTPARWVNRREMAQTYTADEIERIKKAFPYIEGCEVVPAGQKG